MLISVIIITLNEAEYLTKTIKAIRLNPREIFPGNFKVEIIVSDGGSTDGTLQLAQQNADKVVRSSLGRSNQLNAGAKAAQGDILLFLHGDTILPRKAIHRIVKKLDQSDVFGGGFEKSWKWSSHVRLSGFIKFASGFWEDMGNWLVRLLKTLPGDNAVFVKKVVFDQLNGFTSMWICEDFDFVHRLKKYCRKNNGKISLINIPVKTSTRRFEKFGFFKTLLYWVRIYFLWKLGMPPKRMKILFSKYSTMTENVNKSFLRF